MHTQVTDYPSAPWTLQGEAFVATRVVRTDIAREFVPTDLPVVPIAPRKTLALVALIRYGAGSTLEYHELIVAPAIVRIGWRIGGWISHIYVDDEMSRRGGREIWRVPKQLASFAWSSQRVIARHERVSAELDASGARRSRVRMPLMAPMFGSTAQSWYWAVGRGTSGIRREEARVQLRGDGLEQLGFEQRATIFRLERFDLRLDAPGRPIPR